MQRLDHRQVTTYSTANIAEWKKQIARSAPIYTELLKQQDNDNKKLTAFIIERDALDLTLAKTRDTIDLQVRDDAKLQAKSDAKYVIATGVATIVDATKRKLPAVSIVSGLLDETKQFIREEYTEARSHTLTLEQTQRARLSKAIQDTRARIKKEDAIKDALTREAHRLHTAIDETPEFIEKLKNNPGQLCNRVKEDLVYLVDNFEEENPAGQSQSARLVLKALQDTIHAAENQSSEKEVQRKNYLDLCRQLWAIEDFFAEEAKLHNITPLDQELRDRLFAVLDSMHINREDGLPDEMGKINENCLLLNKRNPIFNASLNELNKIEQREYALAEMRLNTTLGVLQERMNTLFHNQLLRERGGEGQVIIPLNERQRKEFQSKMCKENMEYNLLVSAYQTGMQLQNDIRKLKKDDMKFCTNILTQTDGLIRGDLTPASLQRYGKLMEKAPGTPVLWRKVIGAMGVLAGLAIIGLSVFAAIATFGALTPLTILGIKFGVSLGVAAITYGVGLTTMALGESLLLAGTRRGVSEKISNVHASANERSKTSIAFFEKAKPVSERAQNTTVAITTKEQQYQPLFPNASAPPVQLQVTINNR